ncbi:hypothetical protein GGI53_005240 [Rhizobium leguminosarum]|nr:hypothetical protein [Rhizobium leguminosarum]
MALLLSLQEKDIILDVLGRAGHPITNMAIIGGLLIAAAGVI